MSDIGRNNSSSTTIEPPAKESEPIKVFRSLKPGEIGADRMNPVHEERAAASAQIQRSLKAWRAASGSAGKASIPKGAGAPLPDDVRNKMEPKLGASFGNVRVHTGGESADAARGFGARAFTVGSDVHFNTGEFNPGTKDGNKLIAHELTHVVQGQKSGVQRKEEKTEDAAGGEKKADGAEAKGGGEDVEVSDPNEAAEVEADEMAEKATADEEGPESKEGKKEDKKDEKKGGDKKGNAKAAAEDKPEEKPAPVAAKLEGPAFKIYRDDKKDEKKQEAPKEPPKPTLDEDRAMKILDEAFGSQKKIVKGAVQILDQAAYQAAYDAIYGNGPYKWDLYVKPKFGNSNGFAYNGVNYINKSIAGTHTVVHEVLHNNAAPDFAGAMGSSINEGVTDMLTVQACNAAGEPAPVCYPNEQGVVSALAASVGEDTIKNAYFKGAGTLTAAVDKNCKAKWTEIKGLLDAGDFAKAKTKMAKK